MAQLAIKGHSTRGKEVIQILEMLGGQNYSHYFLGKTEYNYYYIGNYGTISCIPKEKLNDLFITFTLEELLEKFPYKVGDKVIAYEEGCLAQFTIQNIRWNYELNKFEYKICSSWCDTSLMIPYKEETMDKAVFDANAQCCDIMNHLIKEKAMEEIKMDIPKGYEFAGVDDDNQHVVFTKIPLEYPKTFKECCEAISLGENGKLYTKGYKASLIQDFHKLLICRDAYWKIAGEQMGLGKPWEPDFTNDKPKYCLYVDENVIECDTVFYINYILSFPTEEMRDAFYENFKELIEQCKELL